MKAAKILTITCFLFFPVKLVSQYEYQAGTSQVSIEPEQSLISLHLGGYGAPRDGRFTLQWIEKYELPAFSGIGSASDKLFLRIDSKLITFSTDSVIHESVKFIWPDGIISFALHGETLFALNNKGEILETTLQGSHKWKTRGNCDQSASLLAVSENTLYVSNGLGTVWKTSIMGKNLEWLKFEAPDDIISITAAKKELYAITGDGVLYRCEPSLKDIKWMKTGYKNNETIREDISHIAIINDRIYGIGKNNMLYLGEHRSEGNLTARALVIKNGNNRVAIVNIDICGLDDEFTGVVKNEIFKKTGIPSEAVFINSSHTHFAPVSQDWLTWQEANQKPDSSYLNKTIRNGIISSIEKALSEIESAELWFGRGTTDIGYNRSLKDHPELYDSAVDVLKISVPLKNKESYLFIASCHPVFSTAGTLHYTISANYPGVARQLVERRTGTSNSIFLQGTAGDINPRDNGEYISGEKLAGEVIAVLKRPMEKITGPVTFYLDTVNIPIIPWKKEEIMVFKDENIDKKGDVYAEKNVKWSELMLSYYKDGKMPESLPVYVQTLNIGNWKLVGLSRETTTEYGFGVKNLWPGKIVSVAGYTNDVSSYLPTSKHLELKNYEGFDSFFWYASPAVFPMDVYDRIIGKIRENNR